MAFVTIPWLIESGAMIADYVGAELVMSEAGMFGVTAGIAGAETYAAIHVGITI